MTGIRADALHGGHSALELDGYCFSASLMVFGLRIHKVHLLTGRKPRESAGTAGRGSDSDLCHAVLGSHWVSVEWFLSME